MYSVDKSESSPIRRGWVQFARKGVVQLLLLLIGLHAGVALHAESADDERIRERLKALTEELNSLDTWLSEAERRRLRLLKELRAKDRSIAEAGTAVAASDAALAAIRTELALLDGARNEIRAHQTRVANRIGEHLAAAYRLQGQGFLKLLLDQQSPAKVERLLIYHRYLVEARVDALESHRRASTELERNAEALVSRQAAEREARQHLVARQKELEQNRRQRQALVATLDKDVEDKVGQRKALLRDQERLQALFAELRKQSSDAVGSGFANRRGALPWPLDGVLVRHFGQPRADGRLQWQGVLLQAEPGSPVKAVYRGRVVFADWLRGFGLLTILDHGNGYMTLYGYADRLAKRPGDLVESGEVIAHAGQSGGAQASGLYFEIRRDGTATDPLKWVAKRG